MVGISPHPPSSFHFNWSVFSHAHLRGTEVVAAGYMPSPNPLDLDLAGRCRDSTVKFSGLPPPPNTDRFVRHRPIAAAPSLATVTQGNARCPSRQRHAKTRQGEVAMGSEVWIGLAVSATSLVLVTVRRFLRRQHQVTLGTLLLANVLNSKYVLRR